jgi:hypothetical protein
MVELRASAQLDECKKVQTTVLWPLPVDIRLNVLVDLVNGAGASATRSQLVAALVATSPIDPDELLGRIRSYLHLSAGEAALMSATRVRVPERRPGRRTL